MLKELFKYVVSLSKPEVCDIEHHTYSDKELILLPRANEVKKPLYMSTLSSLIDYIKDAESDFVFSRYFIQVESPTRVNLVSVLDEFGRRDVLVTVDASVQNFPFGIYEDAEAFLIGVKSQFQETPDQELIIKFAGASEKKTLQSYSDDGISQKVTVSSGLASKETAKVPNMVLLKPYSTFTEIEQPERNFVFRMKDAGGLCCALFEADGGSWKRDAMWDIQSYLEQQLEELRKDGAMQEKPAITVIA